MRRVEFLYEQTEIVWGQYDEMYPNTEDRKQIRTSFDGESSLKQYFDRYYHWLLEVGFSKEEINQQMRRICNYEDELS